MKPQNNDNNNKNNNSNKKNFKNGENKSNTSSPNVETQKQNLFGSWTGMSPLSLLHQHCQKNGWLKPTLNILVVSKKYECHITLSKKDPKTHEIIKVTFSCNKTYNTEQEAKHYSATYTLYQVNSHMPMHRILPPDFSKYWKELEKKRIESGNKNNFIDDPFEARAAAKKNIIEKKEAKQKKEEEIEENKKKKLEALPKLHMTADIREKIEELIKDEKLDVTEFATGTAAKKSNDDQEDLTKFKKRTIVKELIRQGFREANAEEALKFTSNYDDALSWLILNVPEDVLPEKFATNLTTPQINLVQRNTNTRSLKDEYIYRRVITLGFSKDLTESILEKNEYNEYESIYQLYNDYLNKNNVNTLYEGEIFYGKEDIDIMKNDEIVVLQSIYENHFMHPDEETLSIVVPNLKQIGETKLTVYIPPSCNYPFAVPAIIITNDDIPLYIRLHLMVKLGELATTLFGTCMMFEFVSWMEQNADEIIKHPPELITTYEKEDKPLIPKAKISSKKKKTQTQSSNNPKNKTKSKKKKYLKNNPTVNKELLENYNKKQTQPEYMDMLKIREKLPSYKYQEPIIKNLEENQVIIVSGETGCGKSTQTPQFILDHYISHEKGSLCNIFCTQPRRISAMSLAERVAAERNEKVGETVGYIIRGESVQSSNTHLTFITTGVLLRILLNDPDLNHISHIIVDEVHERNVDTDFLLIFLKELISRRKDVKIILMSATMNSQLFSEYFNQAPVFEIPGFTHPVKDMYLEDIYELINYEPEFDAVRKSKDKIYKESKDEKGFEESWNQYYENIGYKDDTLEMLRKYDKEMIKATSISPINYTLIGKIVQFICDSDDDGDILIFMPGIMEIKKCIDTLKSMSIPFLEILPLHANLTPNEQYKVFKTYRNKRKVIVSTNVAETSVTIDGITNVIDSGRVKEMKFNVAQSMMTLVEEWASRASCKQRRGRAGRTRPGTFYRTYSHRIEATSMKKNSEPEILRTPLDQLCLQVKAMGIKDVTDFLLKAIDPPAFANIDLSLKNLKELKALNAKGDLTPLGYHISSIPADLRIAKTLLYGCILQCLDPILTICSCLSLKSPFVSPMDHRDEAQAAKKRFAIEKSDLLTEYNAYKEWNDIHEYGTRNEERRFCEENYLSLNSLNAITSLKRQYYQNLKDVGFINNNMNENSEKYNVIKAALVAGMYPNIVKVKNPDAKFIETLQGNVARAVEAKNIKLYSRNEGRLFIHPSSINFTENNFEDGFILYFNKVETSKAFIRDATMVSACPIFLFGGEITTNLEGKYAKVDDFFEVKSFPRISVLMNGLRKLLDRLLIKKINDVNLDISNNNSIKIMIELLDRNGI